MNDHKKPVPGVEATANPAPSQGRRRLVKGAMLATPAILTLHGGFAWAVSCTNIIRTVNGDYVVYVNQDELGNPIDTPKAVVGYENGQPYIDPQSGKYTLVSEDQMRCGSNFASLQG